MEVRNFCRIGVGVVAALALSSCAPDLGQKPQMAKPQGFATERTFAAPATAWPEDQWWKAYGDAQLDALMVEAVAGSPDIRIAEARLRQAQAIAEQYGADLVPTVTADGELGPQKQSINEGVPRQYDLILPHGWHTQGRVTANVDYELDLFGRNRAAFAAAKAEAGAAAIDVAAARLALTTSVASAYADLVRLNADRQAAMDAARVRRDTAKLVTARYKENLENKGQVSESEAEVSAAEVDVDAIDRAIMLTRDQLAALLGKGPDRGLDIKIPANTQVMPAGLPPTLAIDLVGRRPDIVAARLRAEAASHRIDVAHADFYPNIDLNSYIGEQALDLRNLVSYGSMIGEVAPAVHLPIFDGGRIAGGYRLARADYDEAVAAYDRTVAIALREVADAITNQRTLLAELAHARAALTSSEDAYRIAGLRYRGGLSRYLDVLTAEDKTLTLRRNVADLEAQAFSQNVALVRALGGGFVAKKPV